MPRSVLTLTLTVGIVGFSAGTGIGAPPSSPSNAPPTCRVTEENHAEMFSGEVSGARPFHQSVGPGWTFTLLPQPHGWALRLVAADGLDLSQVTPPFHGPNPRDLFGWHFRNADNSGVNDGSVNAPQRLRLFLFAPSIEGTGGYRPPRGDAPEVDADGRGWLRIDDMGLADLAPGEQARMVYLKFTACLTWPKSAALMREERDRSSPTFTPEEIETLGACGLRSPYEPKAYITPRMLGGDLDGDDAHDHAALVTRTTDGKFGLAVCRAGTYLELVGFDRAVDGLEPGYFEQLEAWTVQPVGAVPRYDGAPPLPALDHDVITLERIEKSSYTLYWDGTRFRARRDYRYVEGE
jgi:hypothetical protein